jgi:hypothetical protein
MIKQDADKYDLLGSLLFVFLFFLFVSVFSDKPVQEKHYSVQFELVNSLSSNPSKAIISPAVKLPSLQKTWVSCIDKMNFKFCTKSFKIASYSVSINQKINVVHKLELIIEPLTLRTFYYFYFLQNSDEQPVLS